MSAISIQDVAAEVRDRLPISTLAPAAGFRPAKGRSGWFHCIHGKDSTPSAHEHNQRLACMGCHGRWSSIDLLMLTYGVDFVGAVRLGAAELGIPWRELSEAELHAHRRVSIDAQRLAQDAADWLRGLSLQSECRKRLMVDLWRHAADVGDQQLEDYAGRQIELLPRLDRSEPEIQVRAYITSLKMNPQETRAIRDYGRDDRTPAISVTTVIVDLLAASQAVKN